MFDNAFALIIFLFPLAYSPGPGNLFFAANGARFGFAATLPANAGYHIATWILAVAFGFGFISAIDRFPEILRVLKYVGSIYVLWIAWKTLRAGALNDHESAKPVTFFDRVVLLVFNPKAYVIIALMFAQFLSGNKTGWVAEVLLIATIFTINNCCAFVVWTLAGDRIAGYFRSPESAVILNLAFGTTLAAVAVWMLLS